MVPFIQDGPRKPISSFLAVVGHIKITKKGAANMANVRVMVVDDSAAMRALFCDILDQAKGVEVVGTARNADEARDLIPDLKPDVLTLDVEMPGMTGMEFLAELMESNPMPVIMLSSVTQEGTGTAQKALELGAVDCFPKPLHTSQEEFTKTVNKLGSIVIAAASSEAGASASSTPGDEESADGVQLDGRIIALAAETGSIEVMREVIAAYPANCPPTIIVLDTEEDLAERAVDRLIPAVACQIEIAKNDQELVAGTVYLAYDKSRHIILENADCPVLKFVERDPVEGHRPSADLLFASMARAGIPSIGGLLAADHKDGTKGLDALAKTGAEVFVQDADEVGPNKRVEAVGAIGTAAKRIDAVDVGKWILDSVNKQVVMS